MKAKMVRTHLSLPFADNNGVMFDTLHMEVFLLDHIFISCKMKKVFQFDHLTTNILCS